MNQQTIDMLTEIKMTAMAAEFANQIQDASFSSIGFEERLSMLVTAEWNRRQNNKVVRLIELHPILNCTPFVRQYDILSNKWGDLLCQEENPTNDTRRNLRRWSWKP